MASRKACTPKGLSRQAKAGFSLIELTIVLGLFAILGTVTLCMSMQSYGGYSFHATGQLLVAALQKARSDALHNVCIGGNCTGGLPHGVHISANQLVLFQGVTYNPNDDANVYVPLQNPTIALGGLTDVVFAQLTADVGAPGVIAVTDTEGRSAIVTVGSEGQISWSN
jgi:prepilin-type N-terminal cleavage/methylation domain-containing protein